MKETIESENYICHVLADSHRGITSCCSECGDRDVWWYSGTGRIIKKDTEESVTFNFQTFTLDEYERWTLREAIVGFPALENVAKSSVKWSISRGLPYKITLLQGIYPKIVDFSLERHFRLVLASEEDIPTCYIAKIDEHELIERGWMVGKG